MITHPFPLLQQFSERLDIAVFTKEDHMSDDKTATEKIGTSTYVSLNQVHGNRTIIASEPSARSEEADGVITQVPELALIIRAADCQNFVFYAPRQNVLGVLHAGWRGLNAGALPAFLDVWKNNWDTHPKDLYVGAGASLCEKCAEFTDPTSELTNLPKKFVKGRNANLQRIADMELREAGILPEHIDRSPDCTKCRADKYFSYRGGDREVVLTGVSNFLVCKLRKNEVRKM